MSWSLHAELLANLLPPVSYDRKGAAIGAELEAQGRALDQVQAKALAMANALSPLLASDELLEDWERALGLPPCPSAARAQRMARLLLKINMGHGDQSKATFIYLASLFGYTVTITNRQPFICGYGQSRVGVTPLAGTWVRYVWDVRGLPTPAPIAACGLGLGSGQFIDHFRAGIHRVGVHPLLIRYTGDTIQDLFEWLKPAHTKVNFL